MATTERNPVQQMADREMRIPRVAASIAGLIAIAVILLLIAFVA